MLAEACKPDAGAQGRRNLGLALLDSTRKWFEGTQEPTANRFGDKVPDVDLDDSEWREKFLAGLDELVQIFAEFMHEQQDHIQFPIEVA